MLSDAGRWDSLMVHVNGTAGRGEHPSPLSLGSRRLARDGPRQASPQPVYLLVQRLVLCINSLVYMICQSAGTLAISVCPESRMTSW